MGIIQSFLDSATSACLERIRPAPTAHFDLRAPGPVSRRHSITSDSIHPGMESVRSDPQLRKATTSPVNRRTTLPPVSAVESMRPDN